MKNLSIILSVLFSICLQSQENWKNIISPEQINELKEINNKYYLATNGGLVIYDPITEEIERITVTDGLPSQLVEDIAIDDLGAIWIGTYESGIAVLEADGSWNHIPAPPTDLTITVIHCMDFDNQGYLWVGTERGTFKYVDEQWESTEIFKCWDIQKGEDGTLYFSTGWPVSVKDGIITEYSTVIDEIAFGGYSCLKYDVSGKTFWLNIHGDFAILDEVQNYWLFESTEIDFLEDLLKNNVEISDDGTVWYVQDGKYIFKYNGNEQELVFEMDPSLWPHLFKNNQGELLLGAGNKIYLIDEILVERADLSNHIEHNSTEIISNEYGQILVMDGENAFQYNGYDLEAIKLDPIQGKENYLGLKFVQFPDNSIAYFERATGKLYHNEEIIEVYNAEDYYYSDQGDGDPFYNGQQFMVDSHGAYWTILPTGLIYNDNNNVYFFDSSNSPFELATPGMDLIWFMTMEEDRNGDVWVSSFKGMGIWRRATSTWDFIPKVGNDAHSIFAEHDMYFDEDNTLWGVGTQGLVKYDGEEWITFTALNSELTSSRLYDIFPLDGQLLISGQNGLSFFDGEGFETYDKLNSGLSSNHCENVVQDGQGNLWIDHKKFGIISYGGISIYNKEGIALGTNSIIQNNHTFSIEIYPNPSSNIINIYSPYSNFTDEKIQMIDLSGKVILEVLPKTQSTTTSIDVGKITAGIYIIKVTNNSQQFSQKVIVQ